MNYLKMKWVMIWSFTYFKSFIYKLVQNMPILKNCWWLQNYLKDSEIRVLKILELMMASNLLP